MIWEVLSSIRVYDYPPFLSVDRQTVRLPNGEMVDDYHKLTMPDTVLIIGFTGTNKAITLNGYRHGVGGKTRMFPGGVIETGETPLVAANRELLEETGYCGGHWISLGKFAALSNYGGCKVHMFKAVNVERTQRVNSDDLEDSSVELIDRLNLIKKVTAGEFKSIGSLAIITLGCNEIF